VIGFPCLLFSCGDQIALACHAKPLVYFSVPLLIWWVLDTGYAVLFNTFLIENPEYTPVGMGTVVRFELPPRYRHVCVFHENDICTLHAKI
jgi:hypothetical protein